MSYQRISLLCLNKQQSNPVSNNQIDYVCWFVATIKMGESTSLVNRLYIWKSCKNKIDTIKLKTSIIETNMQRVCVC